MSVNYTMMFWKSTNNPSTIDKNKMATDGLSLAHDLQVDLSTHVVLPSHSKKDPDTAYIAVLYKTDEKASVNTDHVTEFLNTKAKELGASHAGYVVADETHNKDFDAEELENIQFAAQKCSEDVDLSNAKDQFMLSRKRLDRLRNATDDKLEEEIRSLIESVTKTNDLDQSAWATIIAVAKGIAAFIGSTAFVLGIAYSAYTLIAWMAANQIAISTGGIFLGLTILGALILIFAAIVIGFKGAYNVLLVANSTDKSVSFAGEHITNGERATITDEMTPIPAAFAEKWVPAGFYAYRKHTVIGMGYFGSLFGATFSVSTANGGAVTSTFSVGMDCPLTYLGGTNSIRVTDGDAAKAAQLATDSGNDTDSLTTSSGQKVVVKRAHGGGSVNWGLCTID